MVHCEEDCAKDLKIVNQQIETSILSSYWPVDQAQARAGFFKNCKLYYATKLENILVTMNF